MIVSEKKVSEHWYTRDGEPMYTVVGKTGVRPTTLRDARTKDLVPSVTTILNVAAKPALIAWMQKQVLLSALSLHRLVDENDVSYMDRILVDSRELAKASAAAGTDIHNAIEAFYSGNKSERHFDHVKAVSDALTEEFGDQDWVSEKSFGHELGFGGKCDLHSLEVVVDVKTKDFGPGDDVDGYDEHLMQLAAYRVGLGVPEAKCANIFVSRTHPGLTVIKNWTEDEVVRGWEQFKCLLRFWQLKHNYK
jgi:hypothetical protein